jgi:hypothetical protein
MARWVSCSSRSSSSVCRGADDSHPSASRERLVIADSARGSPSFRSWVLGLVLAFGCGTPSASVVPSSATELPLDVAASITSGHTYVVSGTTIDLEMTQLAQIDTPSGPVVSAVLEVSDGAAHERLDVHAYGPALTSPVVWHQFSFELGTRDYTYGGSTATLTITRAEATRTSR